MGQDAVRHYDRAINHFISGINNSNYNNNDEHSANTTKASLYSNRSAAYLSLALSLPNPTPTSTSTTNSGDSLRVSYLSHAREDALVATQLHPQWSKAWSRLGVACLNLADVSNNNSGDVNNSNDDLLNES